MRCGIVGNHCLTQAHTVAGRIMTRTTRRAATNLTVLPNHTRCCTRHTQCSDACSRKYPNDVASRCCTRHTQYTYTCSRKCPKDMHYWYQKQLTTSCPKDMHYWYQKQPICQRQKRSGPLLQIPSTSKTMAGRESNTRRE